MNVLLLSSSSAHTEDCSIHDDEACTPRLVTDQQRYETALYLCCFAVSHLCCVSRFDEMMTLIIQGGEGLEDKKEDRKATGSYSKTLEESANRALMRQNGSEGWGGRRS